MVLNMKNATQYPNLGDDEAGEEAMVGLMQVLLLDGVSHCHCVECGVFCLYLRFGWIYVRYVQTLYIGRSTDLDFPLPTTTNNGRNNNHGENTY